MKDICALSLLSKEIENIAALPDPPTDYSDITGLTTYEKNQESAVNQAADKIRKVSEYVEAIKQSMEQLRLTLVKTTMKVQEQVNKALSRLQSSHMSGKQAPVQRGKKKHIDPTMAGKVDQGKESESRADDLNILEYTLRMQNLDKRNKMLEESILLNQELIKKIQNGADYTLKDFEKLKGTVDNWLCEEKNAFEKDKRTEEEERLKIEETERKKKEEERDKKRKEEEERLKEEEANRKKKEEEERKKVKKEEEERSKKEEVERKKNEEGERKKKQKEEEERLIAERKKKEEEAEKKKKNRANWEPIVYKRSNVSANAYHQQVCCQVAAMADTLSEDELECLASDEYKEEDHNLIGEGERPASSMVYIKAKHDKIELAVPAHVSIPYRHGPKTDEEVILKAAIDDGDWKEQETDAGVDIKIKPVGLHMKGFSVSTFRTIKMMIVVKPRIQSFLVDKSEATYQSSVDENVKIHVPQDTFSKPGTLKLVVNPIGQVSLKFAREYHGHCHDILSTSSVVTVTFDAPTQRDIELDIKRRSNEDKRTLKGNYHQLYKGKDGQWRNANDESKKTNQGDSVTLPKGKAKYTVVEIESSIETPKEEILKAAEELCYHVYAFPVRVIARQKADNSSMIIIQCVNRERIASQLAELKTLGYTLGPEPSKEFPILEGQVIKFEFSGNIAMSTGSHDSIQLTFHSYMDTAKQETTLQVVDKYKQKNLETYIGQLDYKVLEERQEWIRIGGKGSLPLTLPKEEKTKISQPQAEIQCPHYLTALAKFLAYRLTEKKGKDWMQVVQILGDQKDMEKIKRIAATKVKNPDDECLICEITLQDWIKSRPVVEDKVKPIILSLEKNNRSDLADECRKFVNVHKNFLSDSKLDDMVQVVYGDWIPLAQKIGLSSSDIEACKNTDRDGQVYKMWCKWRVSDIVVQSGLNIFTNLSSTLQTWGKYRQLRTYVAEMIEELK